MSSTDDHLDIEELKKDGRKGWFVKEADDMPQYKKYRRSCKDGGRGFLGPNFGAHHIIPQESVEGSIEDFKTAEEKQQIEDIKYITQYILNNPNNMLGLPTFWSYNAWYAAVRLQSGGQGDVPAEYPGLSKGWMNSYQEVTKDRWRQWGERFLAGISRKKYSPDPSHHPIHAPVSWGHLEYSKQVKSRLKQQVWILLKRQKSKHKISKQALQTIRGLLVQIETAFHAHLTTRGATSPELWERRKDPTDSGWYGPYTMSNPKKNPIWG
ncbi:AHH domain-containing protein [Comamonas sp. JC664]|uniref:AHH domain-containing protein n=1 Tax=Comamonas sp. JC664 TaxID=2801917 RepID=UPI00174DE315|nr:AHH domain-containing protein [Comamonas sp. JC664]MBL0696456.1 AHH domain-containing protein [Comamonas sp. JC664]GHG84323.1 hypothetical protein GCM10012319_39800 [Comamonas sp. KCTC 72670]